MSHGARTIYRVVVYYSDGSKEKVYEHTKQEKAYAYLRNFIKRNHGLTNFNKVGIDTIRNSYLDKRRWN